MRQESVVGGQELIESELSMKLFGKYLVSLSFLLGVGFNANASETDQFLTMDIELDDSAEALNRYLNEQVAIFLQEQNGRRRSIETPEKLVQKYYRYLFKGIHSSRFRSWLIHSEELDRYPDETVSYFKYMRMTVHGMGAFPFFLPMARTIRVGDVYLGVDKIGHFFGFGRRGFENYLKCRARGLGEGEALEKVIAHWLLMERYLVGNLTDGIHSYGDIEANFQGLMMARAFCEGDDPYFKRVGGEWILDRPIDIAPYITPDFDETYNLSHFLGPRKRHVFKVLRRDYCEKFALPIVQERFRRYDAWPRSFSQDFIDRYYAGRRKDPRKNQTLECICGSEE